MEPLSIVVDEVALEGLDGITIPSLWIRLEGRKPAFPLKLDDCTKDFLWRSLLNNGDLKFYQLPQERGDVQLFDRFKNIDPDTGIERRMSFSDAPKDVYPISITPENQHGIQGSCAVLKERTDVTQHVRSKSLAPLLDLPEALERYGRKLVVVASQMLRFRALIGIDSDPDLKLTDFSFCVLERVGRARWQGELQSDLHGSTFKIDAGKLHYMRKALVKHGLITMQSHITRAHSGQQQHSILLLLKRFHVNRRTKYDMLMEYVSNFLLQSPGHFVSVLVLKEQLSSINERSFRLLIRYMRSAKLIEHCQYPLEDLDPEAGPCTNKSGKKVLVRCLKQVKPYAGKGVADDDDEDDDEDYANRALPLEGRIMETDVLTQAYHIVLSAGSKGIKQTDLGLRMNVGRLESRMICRRLEREALIKGFMVDEGRQRTTRYISHRCVSMNKQTARAPAARRPTRSPLREQVSKRLVFWENVCLFKIITDVKVEMCLRVAGLDTFFYYFFYTAVFLYSILLFFQPALFKEDESSSLLEGLNAADNPDDTNIELVTDVCKPQVGGISSTVFFCCVFSIRGDECSIVFPQTREKSSRYLARSHETYRLLRRRNLIIEAVRTFKIVEGFFLLQKIINEEEKKNGLNTKCCRKTVVRLVDGLSREGLLKVYKTTVVQDGINKKMIVHPSIQPSDDVVRGVIEQVRFKISSSYSAVRRKNEEEDASKQSPGPEDAKGAACENLPRDKRKEDDFRPKTGRGVTVRGLGKTLGFQPKMHRLQVVHSFLCHVIYGHPAINDPTDVRPAARTPADASGSDAKAPADANGRAISLCVLSPSKPFHCSTMFSPAVIVYADEDTWKKFVPPVRVHKGFISGWAMVGDLLLCMPLSIFIQVIQVNYKVDGLEEYLSDPVKQHHLIRALPARMKRQLLYKRRYIFSFHVNLQKLVYMGLLLFGPVEKFTDKDQVFVYLRRHATIVDTTSADPHYWLVTESPEKPFERRRYTFNTSEDVENYWFDLMCVCLNTPLGTSAHTHTHTHTHTRESKITPSTGDHKTNDVSLCLGSREVSDDWSTPGDGKGAAGLDSEFFAHLKRNWLWTNHLLMSKSVRERLYVEDSLGVEPATRNKRVVGGKKQKRKRIKQQAVKAPRKNKEPKKRTPAHDEADHRAIKMMTRQRVYWSVQEDSLMMLCRVAAHLLNSKLKRPYVPYCVVRDLLQAEYETSMDKTSVAVGRRTRYILKNPQTLLNYRICLAEAYQDKPLMKLLESKKPDCAKSFSEYARLLREKFRSVLSTTDLVIPDTKPQLFSRTDDIHTLVLENLIQSTLAMTNAQMKSSRSFQTFHMYSQYKQELLCQIFIRFRKRGLVNRRRIHHLFGPKKNRALPFLPMSYQLSHSYHRCFSWRFPHSLVSNSLRFLRERPGGEQADDAPPTGEESPDVSDMMFFSMDSADGGCAVSLSLMSLGLLSVLVSVPRQMVVVDNHVEGNVLFSSVGALEEEEDDDEDDAEECDGKKKLEVKSQASHTKYLMMRGHRSPGIVKLRNLNTTDSIVVESCFVRLKLRDTPAHHLFPQESESTHETHTHTHTQTLQECHARLTQQRGYTAQDIEACVQLRSSLAAAGENGLDVGDLHRGHQHLEEPRAGRTRSLQKYMQDLEEEGQVSKVGGLGARWVLLQHADPWLLTVNSKHWSNSSTACDRLPFLQKGHKIPFLRKRSRREAPKEAGEPPAKKSPPVEPAGEDGPGGTSGDATKEALREEEQPGGQRERADQGGADESPNPEAEGGKPSPPGEDGDSNRSFISRPWRMVDGNLNRQVCKFMLEAVMYHVMSRPGLTQQTLVEHYKDKLQPMAVLDLLQVGALIELGCVTRNTLSRPPKASLFSLAVHTTSAETPVEDPGLVFYEPTISCLLRLGKAIPEERHTHYTQWTSSPT
uniref:B-block binding subunit of TFIIIC domain-containing protein n=1 Tax=Gasterosteus aculeatus aculeatus TaxID=481459 RepID=A0AAQ4P112_GASAC